MGVVLERGKAPFLWRVERSSITAQESSEALRTVSDFFFDRQTMSQLLKETNPIFGQKNQISDAEAENVLSDTGERCLEILPFLSKSELFMNSIARLADVKVSMNGHAGKNWVQYFQESLLVTFINVANGIAESQRKKDAYTADDLFGLTKAELIGVLLGDSMRLPDEEYDIAFKSHNHPAFQSLAKETNHSFRLDRIDAVYSAEQVSKDLEEMFTLFRLTRNPSEA